MPLFPRVYLGSLFGSVVGSGVNPGFNETRGFVFWFLSNSYCCFVNKGKHTNDGENIGRSRSVILPYLMNHNLACHAFMYAMEWRSLKELESFPVPHSFSIPKNRKSLKRIRKRARRRRPTSDCHSGKGNEGKEGREGEAKGLPDEILTDEATNAHLPCPQTKLADAPRGTAQD